MPQHEQLDVLGELVAPAADEQPQNSARRRGRRSCNSRRENTAGNSSLSKPVSHSTAAWASSPRRRSRSESRATIASATARSTITRTHEVSHDIAARSRGLLCEHRRMLLSFGLKNLFEQVVVAAAVWELKPRVAPGGKDAGPAGGGAARPGLSSSARPTRSGVTASLVGPGRARSYRVKLTQTGELPRVLVRAAVERSPTGGTPPPSARPTRKRSSTPRAAARPDRRAQTRRRATQHPALDPERTCAPRRPATAAQRSGRDARPRATS